MISIFGTDFENLEYVYTCWVCVSLCAFEFSSVPLLYGGETHVTTLSNTFIYQLKPYLFPRSPSC